MILLLLVRHAKALSRSTWREDDSLRPLSARGERQAEALADLLEDEAGAGVCEVRTSPALRCTMTVEPFAEQIGLPLIRDDGLFEGCEIELPRRAGTYVWCAHGDNIPWLLRSLGIACETEAECKKGSVWRLEFENSGRLASARYLIPEI